MKKSNKYVDKLMWALRGPILTVPMWRLEPPENIMQNITVGRLAIAMHDEEMCTDTEAMWYISTASLENPLSHHWCNVYMYLTRKHCIDNNIELPVYLREQIVLDEYMEERELYELKKWIYKKSMQRIKDQNKETNSKLKTDPVDIKFTDVELDKKEKELQQSLFAFC